MTDGGEDWTLSCPYPMACSNPGAFFQDPSSSIEDDMMDDIDTANLQQWARQPER